MGRPLNKKFFGDGSGLLAVECYTERAGASTAGYIVRQRSNLIYEIADETVTDVDVDYKEGAPPGLPGGQVHPVLEHGPAGLFKKFQISGIVDMTV